MNELPLKEISINELFVIGEKNCIYEVPIYQRNYAWEKDEISALVQDVYDSYLKDCTSNYFIGTLVSYQKDNNVFEVIDGQQRLTTIYLILKVLGISINYRLTYRSRKKSDQTLLNPSNDKTDINEKDKGIINGYKYANEALNEVDNKHKDNFKEYFLNNVHIIHYQVPKDVDLNHYFEVMNSRGEQLEKHEIVKAKLMQHLSDNDKIKFNAIWNACSQMSVYVQQNINAQNVFYGDKFLLETFDNLQIVSSDAEKHFSILNIIQSGNSADIKEEKVKNDQFQPIIDFPNFLLIILKIKRLEDDDFIPQNFNLDDKFLLNEFEEKYQFNEQRVKDFAYKMLKARFFLDNYNVHHTEDDEKYGNNPWILRFLKKDGYKYIPENLLGNTPEQDKLVHLLSMFEVSFTARQRKNYLFYILLYLLNNKTDTSGYSIFVEKMADRYFNNVYLNKTNLNEINTPNPNSFDSEILNSNTLDNSELPKRTADDFINIYGDGSQKTAGVPLFVFNYLDFKIWELYETRLRGERIKESSFKRKEFFDILGCEDFGLKIFDDFYFSRTRRSLEHFYPQATANGEDGHLDENKINCFGNFAMISASANSMGSNWDPQTKIDHYLKDASGKINRIGVSSLKFMIMMQMCKDHGKWDFEDIKLHQSKMVEIMLFE